MESQNFSQESWTYKIRKFIWPLLDEELEAAETPLFDVNVSEESVVIEDENLDQAFFLISKFADSEEERRKSIESKATLFLSTISIATTLVVASNALLASNTEKSWPVIASVGISLFLTLYTISTVWFSVRALERGNYSVLSFNDLNHIGNAVAYKKHLILSLRKITRSNYKTINGKVDNVALAQEHYKRAILMIGLYAVLIFAFYFFYKPKDSPKASSKNVNNAGFTLPDIKSTLPEVNPNKKLEYKSQRDSANKINGEVKLNKDSVNDVEVKPNPSLKNPI